MDITSPRILYLKGGLFVLAGGLASAMILLEHPTLKVAALLALAIWCFARAYYFAFYVVQHYADPAYRFAGLWSFVRYVMRRRQGIVTPEATAPPLPPSADHAAADARPRSPIP
jgi:hypothetical protein